MTFEFFHALDTGRARANNEDSVAVDEVNALAVLAEYLRVSSHFEDEGGREGVFLVLRTLFDPPTDQAVFPHMMVGAPRPPFPKLHTDAPRFPIVVIDDMPFNVVSGYALGGQAESPEMHLEAIRKEK